MQDIGQFFWHLSVLEVRKSTLFKPIPAVILGYYGKFAREGLERLKLPATGAYFVRLTAERSPMKRKDSSHE